MSSGNPMVDVAASSILVTTIGDCDTELSKINSTLPANCMSKSQIKRVSNEWRRPHTPATCYNSGNQSNAVALYPNAEARVI